MTRSMTRLAAPAFVVLALVVAAASIAGNENARPGEVVDRDGHVRGRIGMLDGDRVGIELCDSAGKPRVVLRVAADGESVLEFRTPTGAVAQLGASAAGVPQLTLSTADGEPRLQAYLLDDGEAALALHDRSGGVRASIRVSADGTAGLSLHDDHQRDRVRLRVEGSGVAQVSILGDDATPRTWLALDSEGTPTVGIGGDVGTLAWLRATRGRDPELVLSDRQGQSRLMASLEPSGAPRLFLRGSKGHLGASLRVSDGVPPELLLSSDGGSSRRFTPADK